MQDYLHSLLTFRRATYIACIPRTSCSITNTNEKYKHKYKYIYKYNDRGSGIECAHNTSSMSNQPLLLVNVATGEEKSNGTKNFPQNSSNSTFPFLPH